MTEEERLKKLDFDVERQHEWWTILKESEVHDEDLYVYEKKAKEAR